MEIAAIKSAVIKAAMGAGGYSVHLTTRGGGGSVHKIRLHGVHAKGETMDAAVRAWIRAARSRLIRGRA